MSRHIIVYHSRRFWVVEIALGEVLQVWGPNGRGFFTQGGAEGWLKTIAR